MINGKKIIFEEEKESVNITEVFALRNSERIFIGVKACSPYILCQIESASDKTCRIYDSEEIYAKKLDFEEQIKNLRKDENDCFLFTSLFDAMNWLKLQEEHGKESN